MHPSQRSAGVEDITSQSSKTSVLKAGIIKGWACFGFKPPELVLVGRTPEQQLRRSRRQTIIQRRRRGSPVRRHGPPLLHFPFTNIENAMNIGAFRRKKTLRISFSECSSHIARSSNPDLPEEYYGSEQDGTTKNCEDILSRTESQAQSKCRVENTFSDGKADQNNAHRNEPAKQRPGTRRMDVREAAECTSTMSYQRNE